LIPFYKSSEGDEKQYELIEKDEGSRALTKRVT
jgi:hypothetical protein